MKFEGTAMGEKKKASYARRDEVKIVRRRGGNGRTPGLRRVLPSSSSVMQRVFEVCRAIFKGPGTVPMPRDVLLLQLLLDEMKPEDVGLSTDLHFFKNRVAKGSPTITYTSIYNGDNFSMCIFFLPPTAVIPLHNHPGMTVFSKLLLGSMHIKSYDWVNNSEETKNALPAQLRLAKLVEDSEFTAPCKTAILYPTTGGNIHTFRAITPCAVLDILGPPYSTKDEHRDCTYYQDYPYSDFAGYISQTMKLGALGIPPYRSFSLDELEAATNNFDISTFIGEGSLGQMYRGKLRDGSLIAVRCLKLRKHQHTHSFTRHIELISKLRHRHLVSALGHCFEYDIEDSSVSTLFLIFEYVTNGTLRNNISGQKLSWTHRIAAAIGVAKGIQFLHAGIIPGLFANNLKITNILVDHNHVAKISCYNLPLLLEINSELVTGGYFGSKDHVKKTSPEDKIDIYDFGVILLEIICGRPITSHSDPKLVKDQLLESTSDDRLIWKSCCNESLKTVMEICLRCLSEEPSERPSIEDVLWNLQFAAQLQDAWRGDSNSSEDSPLSPPAFRKSLY